MSSVNTAPETPAVLSTGRAPMLSRRRHALLQNAPLLLAAIILFGTLALYVFLYHRELDKFPGAFDWTSLTNTALPLVFAAVAQTMVVLTRGIDLSVGGIIDVSNTLAAANMRPSVGSMVFWTCLILLIGALAGLLNGVLVAYARLPPILVTLATLAIFQGIAVRILESPGGHIPSTYTSTFTNTQRPSGLLLVGALVLLWWLFRRTRFGVGVFALGNDEHAALANGLPVRRLKMLVYVMSGVLSAAAGLLVASTTTGGDANAGNIYTLTSIAAVVVGGISFMGGRGSAIGAIFGAFALTLVTSVLFFAHIDRLYTSFYQGLFLIAAVVLGSLAGRLARGGNR
ncbi:MAG: ABC transporter permease [Mycobacteriales bacterium]